MIFKLENRLVAEGVQVDLAQQFEDVVRSELGGVAVIAASLYKSNRGAEPFQVTLRLPGPRPDTHTLIPGSDPEDLRWNLRVNRNRKTASMKAMKTDDGLELELGDVTPWPDERGQVWFVRCPTRNTQFDVSLDARTLTNRLPRRSLPDGAEPMVRDFTQDEIERAVVIAVKDGLKKLKEPGGHFVLSVGEEDLYRAAGL